MSSINKPPRHREEVVATILYFGIFGVDVEVVAALVELKLGDTSDIFSPEECKERLKFASSILDQRGISWTRAGVGGYIAIFTTFDTFGIITAIDETCEKILGKISQDDEGCLIACADCCH